MQFSCHTFKSMHIDYQAFINISEATAAKLLRLPHLRKNRNLLSMICVFQRGHQNARRKYFIPDRSLKYKLFIFTLPQ